MASNETSKYKLSVVEGTELKLSLSGAQGPAGAVGPAGADGEDALWNYTGEYNVGASYAVGDVATYGGETFYRTDAHGGNTGDTPSNVSLYWDLLAAKGEDGGGGGDALPLAGGAMDTGAVITLDTTPDGNGFSTDSEVAGWGFGVQQKENGTNTSLLSYIDTTGFYAESSPAYVTVYATGIPSYGSIDSEVFKKVADFNFKPAYEGDLRLRYSGDRWYMDDYGGIEVLLASVGDESYPWQASWPYSVSITPSVNQTTHLSSTELTFDNGSKLKKGTTDAGLGGNGGIALKCSVDYELKWDAGRLYTMEQDGFTIRRVDHCRNIAPTAADDVTKGFVVGSIWTLDDGVSYECTGNTEGGAAWVAHLPLSLGDGLVFTGSTNTLNTSTNVARRAGNQTFTGNNTFSGQVELTGQALTNGTSAVTRALGDARYGATYVGIKEENVESTNNTPIKLTSVTLPIGMYQIDCSIAATALSQPNGGFLFGLKANNPVRTSLFEIYGPESLTTANSVIANDSLTLSQRTGTTTSTTNKRQLMGLLEVLTNNTEVSIEFCQNTTNAVAATTRKRSYIIARKIA
jgi:hypothetical protein